MGEHHLAIPDAARELTLNSDTNQDNIVLPSTLRIGVQDLDFTFLLASQHISLDQVFKLAPCIFKYSSSPTPSHQGLL